MSRGFSPAYLDSCSFEKLDMLNRTARRQEAEERLADLAVYNAGMAGGAGYRQLHGQLSKAAKSE